MTREKLHNMINGSRQKSIYYEETYICSITLYLSPNFFSRYIYWSKKKSFFDYVLPFFSRSIIKVFIGIPCLNTFEHVWRRGQRKECFKLILVQWIIWNNPLLLLLGVKGCTVSEFCVIFPHSIMNIITPLWLKLSYL